MQESAVTAAWIKLALKLAAEATRRVGMLGAQEEAGLAETRASAPGGIRYWEPDILRMDNEIEQYYLNQLAEQGIDTVLLSEEAGRVKVDPRCAAEVEFDRPIYFVSDPFNKSLQNQRNVPSLWFSSLAIYTRPPRPEMADSLASVVLNCIDRSVVFSDTRSSYEGSLDLEGNLLEWHTIAPGGAEKPADVYLETYLMKPNYMIPAAEKIKFLFRGVKFILPNGGPSGFCDVASGKVGVYFAYMQPHTDIFPGIAVAERAGCSVSTFEGNKIFFGDNPRKRFNLVCSANASLHQRVLELLKGNGITDAVGQEDV